MTNLTCPRIISLTAELARPDDQRRQTAVRWKAALQRLALLRATLNETRYETEWACIFDDQQLMADLRHRSTLLALAALEVMKAQHEQTLIVCDMDGIEYDREVMAEFPELIEAMRTHLENAIIPN